MVFKNVIFLLTCVMLSCASENKESWTTANYLFKNRVGIQLYVDKDTITFGIDSLNNITHLYRGNGKYFRSRMVIDPEVFRNANAAYPSIELQTPKRHLIKLNYTGQDTILEESNDFNRTAVNNSRRYKYVTSGPRFTKFYSVDSFSKEILILDNIDGDTFYWTNENKFYNQRNEVTCIRESYDLRQIISYPSSANAGKLAVFPKVKQVLNFSSSGILKSDSIFLELNGRYFHYMSYRQENSSNETSQIFSSLSHYNEYDSKGAIKFEIQELQQKTIINPANLEVSLERIRIPTNPSESSLLKAIEYYLGSDQTLTMTSISNEYNNNIRFNEILFLKPFSSQVIVRNPLLNNIFQGLAFDFGFIHFEKPSWNSSLPTHKEAISGEVTQEKFYQYKILKNKNDLWLYDYMNNGKIVMVKEKINFEDSIVIKGSTYNLDLNSRYQGISWDDYSKLLFNSDSLVFMKLNTLNQNNEIISYVFLKNPPQVTYKVEAKELINTYSQSLSLRRSFVKSSSINPIDGTYLKTLDSENISPFARSNSYYIVKSQDGITEKTESKEEWQFNKLNYFKDDISTIYDSSNFLVKKSNGHFVINSFIYNKHEVFSKENFRPKLNYCEYWQKNELKITELFNGNSHKIREKLGDNTYLEIELLHGIIDQVKFIDGTKTRQLFSWYFEENLPRLYIDSKVDSRVLKSEISKRFNLVFYLSDYLKYEIVQ